MPTNLSTVPGDRQCGAKTRAGTPCRKWGIKPSGRCRNHGGKSRGGDASPALKHGWYSTYFPYTILRQRIAYQERLNRRIAERLANDDPMNRRNPHGRQ